MARLAALALSSTERPEKARWDAEPGAAKQIKCQRSSKVTAILAVCVEVGETGWAQVDPDPVLALPANQPNPTRAC